MGVIQRWDLRRRVDGKYAGLHYGYILSRTELEGPAPDGSRRASATCLIARESIKDMVKSAKPLERTMEADFTFLPDGSVEDLRGDPLPLLRGWPPILPEDALPGDAWKAEASLMVDPAGSGAWTEIPILMTCSIAGRARWEGSDVVEVKAQYAMRYRARFEEGGPESGDLLSRAEGKREASIYYDPESGLPLFAREKLTGETYTEADGSTVQNDGFILSFFDLRDASAFRRERLEDRELVDERLAMEEGVRIVDDERGTLLSLDKLHFVPDSPELLPGEDAVLARIAATLKDLPETVQFLVIGHTAKAGTVEEQDSLSAERARRIVEALVRGGIAAERFLYEGRGSRDNIGDESTEEGKALNRRVEILLLD